MKASERRARQKDVERRRCPDCRNLNLSDLGMDVLWCDRCGKTDPTSSFPYQQYWVDHLNWKAERDAARAKKEPQ